MTGRDKKRMLLCGKLSFPSTETFSDRVTNERLMQKVTDEVVFLNSEEFVFRFEMSEGQ